MKTFNSRVWLFFFVTTAVMALLVQLLVLPVMFPALHAGHGLVVGGDWTGFHQIAQDLAERIRSEGWSAWRLRPHDHSPAGIAALIYAVSISEPYALIPLNAAVHASAGLILVALLQPIVEDRMIAFLAAVPFIVFPSAATWYAQIHRDGYYILGMLLFCYGWVRIVTSTEYDQRWWQPSLALILSAFGGVALVWVARPYALYLLFVVSLLLAFFIMPLIFCRALKQHIFSKKAIAELLSIILLLGSLHLIIKNAWLENVDGKLHNTSTSELISLAPGTETTSGAEMTSVQTGWKKSEWLPERVDALLFSVAVSRQSSILIDPNAKSVVDKEIGLYSVGDFVRYFPRALQVALLAPFPSQWFDAASSAQGGVMRKVAAVEMTFVYASLMWLPFALWRWRRKAEIWVVMLFATPLLALYGYVMPNVGSLYRMRYGFFMVIVGIAFAAALSFVLERGTSAAPHSS